MNCLKRNPFDTNKLKVSFFKRNISNCFIKITLKEHVQTQQVTKTHKMIEDRK